MTLRYFGTDGIRGVATEPPLGAAGVARWGRAWAQIARERGVERVALGWDPRLSSAPLARAFVGGAQPLIEVHALGMVPTPAVSLHAQAAARAWGVVISASHNPPADNGIKGFDHAGYKLGDGDEAAIEAAFDATGALAVSDAEPRVDAGAVARYASWCGRVELPDDVRVVVDCAHGATGTVVPHALVGRHVRLLGVPPDGARINARCGATDLAALRAAVLDERADLGIAFDGDGDRCMLVAADGAVVDGDQILWLLVQARIAAGDAPPGVAGTLMSNGGLEAALRRAGVAFARTDVGDRFLAQELRARGWDLGAESCGHVIQRRVGPTGDGLATAVAVTRELLRRGRARRWDWRFVPWPQRTVSLAAAARVPLAQCSALERARAEIAAREGDALRLVVRWSGTEPRLRLSVEGADEARVQRALEHLADAARADLARAT